jgi:hypothetical protein
LGRLAQLFGMTRKELLRLPMERSLLLDLATDKRQDVSLELWGPPVRAVAGRR